MKTDQNIVKELEELSPTLHKLKLEARNPFRVPDGYFGSLKDQVFRHIHTGLADDAGKDSFKIPENYFDQLTADIMEQVEVEEGKSKTGKVIDLQGNRRREKMNVRRWTVMAASVALFLMLGIAAVNIFNTDSGSQWADDFPVSEEETLEYLEEHWDTYETEDLIALVDISDADVIPAMGSGFEDELEEYLNENIDDLEDYLLNAEI